MNEWCNVISISSIETIGCLLHFHDWYKDDFQDFAHAELSNYFKIYDEDTSFRYRRKTDNWLNHHLSMFSEKMNAKKIIIIAKRGITQNYNLSFFAGAARSFIFFILI